MANVYKRKEMVQNNTISTSSKQNIASIKHNIDKPLTLLERPPKNLRTITKMWTTPIDRESPTSCSYSLSPGNT